MNAAQRLTQAGQSLWLDNLSRSLIAEGTLARHIHEHGITGLTSNPAIFRNALATSPLYAEALAVLRATEPDPERRFEALAVPDIQAACDLFAPVFERTRGLDGYVSLEVSPRLAHDTAGTVAAAERLAARVARPNLLIKVPGTPAGLAAFETLTARGINVNVTLLFSPAQTRATFEAYRRGLAARHARGERLDSARAVASLFMSRVDTAVDATLEHMGTPEALALRGKTALAMARQAYLDYRQLFGSPGFAELAAAGARPQWLLWASTGVKNPAYPALHYVTPLVAPETVNTLPDATLDALVATPPDSLILPDLPGEDTGVLDALASLGIDLETVGARLQNEGVAAFDAAYAALLQAVA